MSLISMKAFVRYILISLAFVAAVVCLNYFCDYKHLTYKPNYERNVYAGMRGNEKLCEEQNRYNDYLRYSWRISQFESCLLLGAILPIIAIIYTCYVSIMVDVLDALGDKALPVVIYFAIIIHYHHIVDLVQGVLNLI